MYPTQKEHSTTINSIACIETNKLQSNRLKSCTIYHMIHNFHPKNLPRLHSIPSDTYSRVTPPPTTTPSKSSLPPTHKLYFTTTHSKHTSPPSCDCIQLCHSLACIATTSYSLTSSNQAQYTTCLTIFIQQNLPKLISIPSFFFLTNFNTIITINKTEL